MANITAKTAPTEMKNINGLAIIESEIELSGDVQNESLPPLPFVVAKNMQNEEVKSELLNSCMHACMHANGVNNN